MSYPRGIADDASLNVRIVELGCRSHEDIVQELREQLEPILETKRYQLQVAPIILRLLRVRLKKGDLRSILDLHLHPQMFLHEDVLQILRVHDVDYLLLEAQVLGILCLT